MGGRAKLPVFPPLENVWLGKGRWRESKTRGDGRAPSKWGGSELCPFTLGPGSGVLIAPPVRLVGPEAGLLPGGQDSGSLRRSHTQMLSPSWPQGSLSDGWETAGLWAKTRWGAGQLRRCQREK